MELTCDLGGVRWRVDLADPIDISIPQRPFAAPEAQCSAFGLPPATATLACSVDGGASVNCPLVHSLCAHAGGTHTECAGHALPGRVTLGDLGIPRQCGLMPALLVSVAVAPLGGCGDEYAPGQPSDGVVGLRALREGLAALAGGGSGSGGGSGGSGGAAPQAFAAAALGCLPGGALILRTPPTPFKHLARWSGTNPPYLTPALMEFALALGVQHLVVDLPSVDREEDGGQLLAHRAWWQLPPRGGAPACAPFSTRTITELALVGEGVSDGPYLLNLQLAPLELEAAPSRPVLHRLTPVA